MDSTKNANNEHFEYSMLDTVVTTCLLTVGFAGACVLAIVATTGVLGG